MVKCVNNDVVNKTLIKLVLYTYRGSQKKISSWWAGSYVGTLPAKDGDPKREGFGYSKAYRHMIGCYHIFAYMTI